MTPAIEQLINSFASNLYVVVRAEMRAEVATVLGDGGVVRLSNGRVPHTPLDVPLVQKKLHKRFAAAPVPLKAPRKKGPVQLCPMPGCKERAAPVFGMVCKKHKDAPKKLIAKYREIRRAKAKKAA